MNILKKRIAALIVFFLIFVFLFAGCDSEGDAEYYSVDFYLSGSQFRGSTVEVRKGYTIPMTNETIAAYACGRGLYKGTTQDISSFWRIFDGVKNDIIWDFGQPVTRDLILMADLGNQPEKIIIAGRGKDFYDNAMSYINDPKNAGGYIMVLGEDAGVRENEGDGIKNREVNSVTFSSGVDLTIIGIGGERTIYTKGNGVFVLPGNAEAPIKLTLGNNITVRGNLTRSGDGMIKVGNALGGDMEILFTMLDGSKVTGYTNSFPSNGAGNAAIVVEGYADKRGNKITFHMKGGIVTGNENAWTGGTSGSGVTVRRGNILLEGNAVITGNTGFGGDIACGMNAGWPLPEDLFIEIKDNATIGEVFLFTNRGESYPMTNSNAPHIKIHGGWTGQINKLNLGWTRDSSREHYMSYSILRNASASGIGNLAAQVGSIAAFIPKITLGDFFQWETGYRSEPNEIFDNYIIRADWGRLQAK